MRIIPPCRKCPYKLELVEFIKSPCPQCILENYKMFDKLIGGNVYRLDSPHKGKKRSR